MEILRQALSVLLVFALLGAALWALRRRGSLALGQPWWRRAQGGSKSLQSIERLSLTPQHSLHLIRIDGRDLVVATHPQGCTVLTEPARGASA